jgi:hypothetical protein
VLAGHNDARLASWPPVGKSLIKAFIADQVSLGLGKADAVDVS